MKKGCNVKSRSLDLKWHLFRLLWHVMALCQPPKEPWLCWQNKLFLALIIYSDKERLSHTLMWHRIGYRSVSLFSFYLSISITSYIFERHKGDWSFSCLNKFLRELALLQPPCKRSSKILFKLNMAMLWMKWMQGYITYWIIWKKNKPPLVQLLTEEKKEM